MNKLVSRANRDDRLTWALAAIVALIATAAFFGLVRIGRSVAAFGVHFGPFVYHVTAIYLWELTGVSVIHLLQGLVDRVTGQGLPGWKVPLEVAQQFGYSPLTALAT